MNKLNVTTFTFCLMGALPLAASAQPTPGIGPEAGEREFSISGTGASDQSFDVGSFGVSGEVGWYLQNNMVAGVRQSINYASIPGEGLTDDFWNGTTRGYFNFQFLEDRARPFIGASLGAVYGDGVNESAFAGLEGGVKYYVLNKTFFLARVDYQFLFDSADDAIDSLEDDGSWAYTLGIGYNF